MENYYNNIPTDEQEVRDHVSHFMYRTDMVMKQPVTIHDRHDDLCRLVITIADYYPDSIAPNPGRVLAFRKAVVDPVTGLKAHFDFETFVQLFKQNVNFEERLPFKGDLVFFLTLSLWYEVANLREMMAIKGVTFNRFDKELRTAREQARERQRQEELLRMSLDGARNLPPHFSMSIPNKAELANALDGFKSMGWVDERTRKVDWFYRLTSYLPPNEYPSQEPIRFHFLNQCRYFVKNHIFKHSDVPKEAWRKAIDVFAVDIGDITRLQRANKIPSGSNYADELMERCYRL